MLKRTATAAALLALLARPARAQDDAAAVKELLKEAASVEAAEKELSPAALQKLAAALEADFMPIVTGKVTLFTAKGLPNPLGDPETLETAWTVTSASGETRVAVIAFRDPASQNALTIAAVHLLAPAAAAEGGLVQDFLRKFEWRAIGADAYEPVSGLESRRAAAKEGTGDAAKPTGLLLSLLHHMHEVEEAQQAIETRGEAKDEAGTLKAAGQLVHEYEEAKEVFDQSDFVFPGAKAAREKPLLLKHLDKALAEAQGVKAAAEEKKLDLAVKRVGDIGCGGCHGSFKPYFIATRTQLKIGDGYFQPGHDLPHGEGDAAPLAKPIAAAARKALLTIDQLLK